jgi:hypothetical protein
MKIYLKNLLKNRYNKQFLLTGLRWLLGFKVDRPAAELPNRYKLRQQFI